MTALVLTAFVFFIVYAVLLLYYYVGWINIPVFISPDKISAHTFVSIIVPARNEALNLPVLLQSLVAQSYPADIFEVIIIDDHSTDRTAEIVSAYSHTNIKMLSLKDYTAEGDLNSYKKKAIGIGIEQSKGTLIVTTDADCYLPQKWLASLVSFYEKHQPVFIAAPVSINNGISFIEIFQALDFMTLQGITGASVNRKFHSMCNGANMAYEKKVFYEVGGFKGIDNIASGDDMLLMHKIFSHYPEKVMFLKSVDAIAETQPVRTIGQFLNQRIRWASKADKYDDKRLLPVLLIVYVLNVLLLAIPIACIFYNPEMVFFHEPLTLFSCWLCLLLLKTAVELFFLIPIAAFFKKISLLFLFPFMQPFHILYTVIAGWLGKFGSYKWKGRKVL